MTLSSTSLSTHWQQQLHEGAIQLNLNLSSTTLTRFSQFTELLLKWNKTYNLTSIDNIDDILTLHLLDSLAIAPYIMGPHILDVGTGAGFPGIPLALALPSHKFTLLDSNNKKIRFLRHAILHLALTNVEVAQVRMEEFHPDYGFETIVTRATSSISEIITQTQHLSCNTTQWLFMKGKYPEQELQDFLKVQNHILHNFAVTITVQCLRIPRMNAERHLVRVARSS